jgi:hypothetical protein
VARNEDFHGGTDKSAPRTIPGADFHKVSAKIRAILNMAELQWLNREMS